MSELKLDLQDTAPYPGMLLQAGFFGAIEVRHPDLTVLAPTIKKHL